MKLLLLALCLALAGCLVTRPDDRPTPVPTAVHTPAEPPVLGVVAARAVSRTLTSHLEALGTVAASRSANLGADVSGRVLEMNVDLGDPVAAGQVLAVLDTRDAELQARVSRAQLGESVAKVGTTRQGKLLKPTEVPAVKKAKANMDNAFKAYDDYRKLRSEDLVSLRSLEDKRSSYLQAKADYESALEQVRQNMAAIGTSQATHAQDQAKIDEAVLRAPFAGYVQQKGIDVGDYVTAGSATGLIIMARHPLYVMLDVPQQQTRQVQEGRRLTFTCDAYPEQRLQAVVTRIAPTLDPTSRALSVKARVDGAPGWLRPGMAVKAELATSAGRRQTLVPAAAILTQKGESRVFVLDKDVARSRPVKVLERLPGWVVVEGVRPGERVAASDLLGMRDGTRVKVTRELPGASPVKVLLLWLALTLLVAAQPQPVGKSAQEALAQDMELLPERDPRGPSLSLGRCLHLAFQSHPVLAEARSEVMQAEAGVQQVYALYYPTMGIAGSRQWQGTETSSGIDGGNLLGLSLTSPASALGVGGALLVNQIGVAFGITQTIFDGGQRKEQLVGAREALKSKILGYQATGLDQYQKIQEAYADAVEAELIAAADRDSLVRAELNRDITTRFYEDGEKARTDVTQAETQVAQAEVQLAQSRTNERDARVHLAQVVGVPLASLVNATLENLLAEPVKVPERDAAVLAMELNPALLSLAAGAAVNRSMERYQWKTLLPTVTGQAGYGLAGFNVPDVRFWTVGLQVIIPFYQPGVEPSAAKYRAQAEQLEHQRDALRLQLLEQVDLAYSDVEGARQRAAAAARQVRLAVQTYWMSYKRYRGGVTEVTELINTRGAVGQAQTSYIQALHDAKVAEGKLLAVLNIVPTGLELPAADPPQHAVPKGLERERR